jgi:hypothetical protein
MDVVEVDAPAAVMPGHVDGGAALADLDLVTVAQPSCKGLEDELAKEVLIDALILDVLDLLQALLHRLVKRREVGEVGRLLHELLPHHGAQV